MAYASRQTVMFVQTAKAIMLLISLNTTIHAISGNRNGETEMNETLMKTEYSTAFDEKRKGLIEQSYYKYGPARMNFSTGNVDAIESLKMCLAKFEETGNLEYLCDVANYAMFRFMFPQQGEYFKHTNSDESAGLFGMSVNEMERFKQEHSFDDGRY